MLTLANEERLLERLAELAVNTNDIVVVLDELPRKLVSEYIRQMREATNKILGEEQ